MRESTSMAHNGQELRDFNKQPIIQNVIYHSRWKVESAWSPQWLVPDIRKRDGELTDQDDGNMLHAPHGALYRHEKGSLESEMETDPSAVVQIHSTPEW
jgi:hypothetical protein